MTDFILGGSKITANGDYSHEIKRCLLLERKVTTNLDSILKSRDITLPTKVQIIKAMVFPVVMYECESWTVKKAECQSESESESCSVVSDSLRPRGLYSPWNCPGQNTGMGSLSLLQRIVLTQGSNPGLLHCRWILYHLSHKGSPRILGRVTYPFSSRSFRRRNQTGVSCIAGAFFTN